MALGDLLEAVVVLGERRGDRLEAVAGDLQPPRVVHDRRAEHQLVVRLGLDQDDVDALVSLLPVLDRLVQAGVGDQAEGLVGDRRQAHVGDAAHAGAEDGRDRLLEVVDVGDERVDDDDELRPLLDRDVDVGGRADAAVDQLAALQVDRLVDDGQRGRAGDRLGDRHVVPARLAEDEPLAGVEVGCGQVELFVEQAEVVHPAGVGQRPLDVFGDPLVRVEAGRQRLGEADADVDRREIAHRDQAPRQLQRAQRQQRRFLQEAEVVEPERLAEVEVLELGRFALVDHLHHLVGRDPVGEHRRDEGAGAGADVDVEVVDRAVDGEQVERPQGADLVDAAGEAAAAEHQGGLRRALASFAANLAAGGRLDVDDLAHKHGLSQRRRAGGQARGTSRPDKTRSNWTAFLSIRQFERSPAPALPLPCRTSVLVTGMRRVALCLLLLLLLLPAAANGAGKSCQEMKRRLVYGGGSAQSSSSRSTARRTRRCEISRPCRSAISL